VLSEERPVFDRIKPGLMLAALAYHDREVEEEVELFDAMWRPWISVDTEPPFFYPELLPCSESPQRPPDIR
jgi:hypothetical protein